MNSFFFVDNIVEIQYWYVPVKNLWLWSGYVYMQPVILTICIKNCKQLTQRDQMCIVMWTRLDFHIGWDFTYFTYGIPLLDQVNILMTSINSLGYSHSPAHTSWQNKMYYLLMPVEEARCKWGHWTLCIPSCRRSSFQSCWEKWDALPIIRATEMLSATLKPCHWWANYSVFLIRKMEVRDSLWDSFWWWIWRWCLASFHSSA